MPAPHILLADDQVPPDDVPEQEFRKSFLSRYGDNPHNRGFLDQCGFMAAILQDLRDSGYRVTSARTFRNAANEIKKNNFDLAIIDLGWYMDFALPEKQRPAAGWSLCDMLDAADERRGRRTPQVVFSSRFPTQPSLSLEAARRGKLPLFKEPSETVRNSLKAVVGFVDATLAQQRSASPTNVPHFDHELEDLAVSLLREPLYDCRRWARLTLWVVGLSVAVLLAGIVFVTFGSGKLNVLSPIASVLTTAISTLMFKRLTSAQTALETSRKEVIKQLQERASRRNGPVVPQSGGAAPG